EKVIEVTNKQEKPKLPDWVHSNLKSLVYEPGLENKVWEINKKESKTCLLYNKSEPLFESNKANLKPIMILTCFHSFYLRYIIISLKNNMPCPQCQQPIYPKDDNNAPTLLKEEEYIVKKLLNTYSKNHKSLVQHLKA
ncbi:16635_t:CDS:2, partial [Gigaspora margarita]